MQEKTSAKPRISGEEIQEIIDKRVEQLIQKEQAEAVESNDSDGDSAAKKRKRLFVQKRQKKKNMKKILSNLIINYYRLEFILGSIVC